jgi:hypothetical protein
MTLWLEQFWVIRPVAECLNTKHFGRIRGGNLLKYRFKINFA